jgi:hypothetical protein
MILPVFAEAKKAAGRELCQAACLPCQKEAIDSLPPKSFSLVEPVYLGLLERGCPIGQL